MAFGIEAAMGMYSRMIERGRKIHELLVWSMTLTKKIIYSHHQKDTSAKSFSFYGVKDGVDFVIDSVTSVVKTVQKVVVNTMNHKVAVSTAGC